MPPLLFVVLSTPMTKLAHMIFPTAMANGVIAGSFTFCKCARLPVRNYFSSYRIKMSFTTSCITRKSQFSSFGHSSPDLMLPAFTTRDSRRMPRK